MRHNPGSRPCPRLRRRRADNPTTPEQVALGRLLFWDPILSGPKDVACATCHHPGLRLRRRASICRSARTASASARHGAFAAGHTPRSSSGTVRPMLNVAFNGLDRPSMLRARGRADVLGSARAQPRGAGARAAQGARGNARRRLSPKTRAVPAAVARLAAIPEYRPLFARAFGSASRSIERQPCTALAAFERTLVAANSPFDRYMRGDATAMTPTQISGMERFQTAGCVNCHNGPMFSDFKLRTCSACRTTRSSPNRTPGSARRTRSARPPCATLASRRRTCTTARSRRSRTS